MTDARTPRPLVRISTFAVLAASTLVAACVAQTLPGATADPQAPPSTRMQPPAQGSGEGIVVMYRVRCRACSVQFTTPSGVEVEPDVEGSFRRTVQFAVASQAGALTLVATPTEQERILDAEIRVGSNVRAESGRGGLGQPVTLTAVFP